MFSTAHPRIVGDTNFAAPFEQICEIERNAQLGATDAFHQELQATGFADRNAAYQRYTSFDANNDLDNMHAIADGRSFRLAHESHLEIPPLFAA